MGWVAVLADVSQENDAQHGTDSGEALEDRGVGMFDERGRYGIAVVGQDGSELRLDGLMVLEQASSITGQCPQLREDRGRNRERAPVGLLVPERVREHERVEDVIFDRRDPVALRRPGRDLR